MSKYASDGNKNGYDKRAEELVQKFIDYVKQGPVVGLKEINEFPVRRTFLERWDAGSGKIDTPKNENDYLERIGVVYLFGIREMELASGLCYDETKWEGGLKCRTSCTSVIVSFSHPSLDTVWAKVQECANTALAAATVAALLSGSAAAVTTFKETFYVCITSSISWAGSIQVKIELKNKTGNWHWCA